MNNRVRRLAIALLLAAACVLPPCLDAQSAPRPPAEVDRSGVLRWTATGREVSLFGVNYAAPFAYDYQAFKTLSIDPKRAIDQDVAHLARLGIDAYRIHVWDREVSDKQGNLLANEHLDLLDYLIAQLAERGIKTLLTPIAWWGPGYPAPDHPSPGFSNDYTKQQMAVDTMVRRAQAEYVAQFVAHVNPYTQLSYRDDPNIIAFEIFNEPWHDLSPPEETTRYINLLVAAMRGTGLRKPIFYNISEHYTPAHGRAVCAANIQGVSAQWYPTGLVRGGTLPGNPLPNVDRYPLPWTEFPDCANKARMVYEFDGADVAMPVMYPAMARAFRGAGFQWATQFAYDPLAIAHTNTEYQTHFLNLVYTPAKAISFLIAGEVFRQIPRGFDAGVYPASERFGAFRTSYAEQLSEYVGDSVFAHTGHTATPPKSAGALRHVAGVGHSPVVAYDGSGAYFLDRLAPGVWRLEVFPDAVPVEDPHSRGNLRRTVTRVYWRSHDMRISLPDLGAGFSVVPLDAGNTHRPQVSAEVVSLRPGVYLLTRSGISAAGFDADRIIGAHRLGEFYAPATSEGSTVVRHEAPPSIGTGESLPLRFDIAQASAPDSVLLFARYAGWQGFRRGVRLISDGPYSYRGNLQADTGRTGLLEYALTVFNDGVATSYPGAQPGVPSAWDYAGAQSWTTQVDAPTQALVLFDAARDRAQTVGPGWMDGMRPLDDWVAGSAPERRAWALGVERFGPSVQHVAFRSVLPAALRARVRERAREPVREPVLRAGAATPRASVSGASLSVRVRSRSAAPSSIEIALVLSDGSAWGTTLNVSSDWSDLSIPLDQLQRVPLVLLPRPFPGFLPYDLTSRSTANQPSLDKLEAIQWGFRRGASSTDSSGMHIEIERVELRVPMAR